MPIWGSWVTLIAAVLSAVFAGIGVGIVYWRGRSVIKVDARIEPTGAEGRFWVSYEIVNTGGVPVWIKKVALTRGREPEMDVPIEENDGQRIRFPYRLEPLAALFAVSSAATLDPPYVRDCDGMVAVLTDGRRFRKDSPSIRQFAAQLKAAAAKAEEPN